MALDIILIDHCEDNIPPADLLVAILSDTPGNSVQERGSLVSPQSRRTEPADVLFGMSMASIFGGDWAF